LRREPKAKAEGQEPTGDRDLSLRFEISEKGKRQKPKAKSQKPKAKSQKPKAKSQKQS
jgi:hypothetical protein